MGINFKDYLIKTEWTERNDVIDFVLDNIKIKTITLYKPHSLTKTATTTGTSTKSQSQHTQLCTSKALH